MSCSEWRWMSLCLSEVGQSWSSDQSSFFTGNREWEKWLGSIGEREREIQVIWKWSNWWSYKARYHPKSRVFVWVVINFFSFECLQVHFWFWFDLQVINNLNSSLLIFWWFFGFFGFSHSQLTFTRLSLSTTIDSHERQDFGLSVGLQYLTSFKISHISLHLIQIRFERLYPACWWGMSKTLFNFFHDLVCFALLCFGSSIS